MTENSTSEFVKAIRELLSQDFSEQQNSQAEYLDLGEISECTPDQLQVARTVLPKENPVYAVFTRIIQALEKNEVDHARLGINELLQAYLLQTEESKTGGRERTGQDQAQDHNLEQGRDQESKVFLEHLYLIVQFFTRDTFPFERYFYDYLMKCYHPLCSFLLAGGKTEEIQGFMEHIVSVGKIAAQRQLDTCSLHHLLRKIETFAAQEQLQELASKAKDSRHTLEL